MPYSVLPPARTSASNSLMVGSSPNTSSPTSAFDMAFRIPDVGCVTVSLRMSMAGCRREKSPPPPVLLLPLSDIDSAATAAPAGLLLPLVIKPRWTPAAAEEPAKLLLLLLLPAVLMLVLLPSAQSVLRM